MSNDHNWLFDLRLIGELSRLNRTVGVYILRSLDADAGRAEPTSVDDELELGQEMSVLGQELCQRARRRVPETTGSSPMRRHGGRRTTATIRTRSPTTGT